MVRSRRHPWWVHAGILAIVAAVAFWLTRSTEQEAPALFSAPDFELVDQSGAPLSSGDLEGTVWVASFIYTSCPDICPVITARLAALADSLAAEGLLGDEVRLVTFTVDPERDTPAVLQAYAERAGAERPGWSFVTGEPDVVHPLIREGFFIGASRSLGRSAADTVAPGAATDHAAHEGAGRDVVPDSVPEAVQRGIASEAGAADTAAPAPPGASPDGEPYLVTHSDYLLLVDRAGEVRGIYSGTSGAELRQLLEDVRALAR